MGMYVRSFFKKHLVGLVAVSVTALAMPGCGSNDDKPSTQKVTLSQPSKPTVAQCGRGLVASAKPKERPASAGTYRYKTVGKRELIGEKRRDSRLPARTEVIVTPARMVDNVWCYMIQRRYDTDLGNTGTVLIRGSDVYISKLRFQSGSYVKTLSPRRPLLTLSGTDLDWSGVFRGRTSGRYAAEIIGRKSMKVGSRKVRVVGVKSRISYDGEIEGWERSTRWISAGQSLAISEEVVQQRKLGLDRLRLTYKTRLISLDPG